MSKRVLLIAHEFPPAIGGAGSVASNMVNALQGLGMDVWVLTRKLPKRKSEKSSQIIEVPFLPKLGFWSYRKKIAALKVEDFDHIILNDIGAALVACMAIPKDQLYKCLIWLHGSGAAKIFRQPSLFFKLVGFQKRYWQLLEKSSRIIAVSDDLKKKFVEQLGPAVLARDISVINNPLNTDIFSHRRIDLHKLYSLDPSRKLLLSVGRIVREKGFDEMYECFKALLNCGGQYSWIVIGDGDYLPELKSVAIRDGLASKIRFLGVVAQNRLAEYYSSVDVFWLLSRYREAFPMVYLEALACGTPVVARPSGGCVDVLKDGKYGMLIRSKEECLRALLEEKYRAFDSQDLVSYASSFSLSEFQKKIAGYLVSFPKR